MSAELQRIPKEQSLLALNLPGIADGRELFQYEQSSNYNFEVYYAAQIANGSNYPRGQFYYTILAPGRIWTDQRDLDEQWIRAQAPFLKDRQLRNVQGVRGGGSQTLRTARFQVDQSECVAVSYVIGGINVTGDLSVGSLQGSVRGFYCARSGDALSEDDVRDVLSGIQIGRAAASRTSLVPPRPGSNASASMASSASQPQRSAAATGNQALPLAIVWDGFASPMTGTIAFSDETKPQGTVEVLTSELKCNGSWRQTGVMGGSSREGFWTVTCDNGIGATGKYKAVSAGRGSGEGVDSAGRQVKFSFGR